MFILAAAAEPSRGWGGPVALLIVAAVYVTGATLHQSWMERRDLPSPTEEDDPSVAVSPQVGVVSDTDDTNDGSLRGPIIERGGRRVRVYYKEEGDGGEVDLDLGGDEPETLEEAVARLDRQGVAYAEIVRRVMADYGVSESTAKRRIRDVRAAA